MYKDRKIKQTLTSNLIINENYFIFNNAIYKQKERVSIGSQILGILAE